jgi:hypothetical protein
MSDDEAEDELPDEQQESPDQRDAKLTETFNLFQRRPEVIAAHVARFW